jgi:outer membrane protein OmpA-like peptidoglycan-associated protein
VEASPSGAAQLGSPSVSAAISGGKVVLTGKVPSKEVADALVKTAEATFGAGNVDNQLTVDATVSDTGIFALGGVLAALGKASSATAALDGGVLTLTGTVPGEDAKKAAVAAAATVTGDIGKVQDKLTVASAPTSGPQVQLLALPQITFQNASASLTSAGYAAVRQAAEILKANPNVKVRIEGHTDDNGDSEINRELSVARAANVRLTLRTLGIADDRMSYRGYGETRPKVANTSDANRAMNRRVEFVVL